MYEKQFVSHLFLVFIIAIQSFIYLFIEGLYYSPVNRTGSLQGFKLNQILQKLNTNYNTKHAHFINVKHKQNQKASPFGIALIKNGKRN